MGKKTVIHIQDLFFSYEENPVLQQLDFSIQEGDLLALVGPNGSGKTTLLKILLGILSPKAGRVLLDNKPLQSYAPKERAKHIAYVSQQPALNFPLTAFELVALGRYPHSGRFKAAKPDAAAVNEALKLTETIHLRERKFSTLSGGEKQKVLISRALAQSARILLLDEPTLHLDLYHQIQILKILKELCVERSAIVVAVLHELNLVSLYADKVAMLRRGIIHAFGPVREVLNETNIKEVFGVAMAAREESESGARYFIPRDRLA